MTPYKKARPGQPLRISAYEWNAVREMIPGLAPTIMDPGDIRSGWEGDTILVVNATGSDRDQFEIMKINAPIITPTEGLAEFKRRVALSCVAVTDGSPFVVLAEPIKAGKIGRAIVSGCAPVRVTGTAASFVTASAGVYATLAMSSSGTHRVLWDEGGSGTRWAIIRIGDGGGSVNAGSQVSFTSDQTIGVGSTFLGSWTAIITETGLAFNYGYDDGGYAGGSGLTVVGPGVFDFQSILTWNTAVPGDPGILATGLQATYSGGEAQYAYSNFIQGTVGWLTQTARLRVRVKSGFSVLVKAFGTNTTATSNKILGTGGAEYTWPKLSVVKIA